MTRRIDHVVLAVGDLEEAAALYRRLGFQVGARNRHPWGTENRVIQFASSFIELITVGDDAEAIPPHALRRFSFGAFVRDTLREREGLAMLVLDSADAGADAETFAGAGIGDFEPFFFERKARHPDGAETRVAFTLAFAADGKAPNAAFFVCQQHFPENFWNPDFQRHPNGATNIAAVAMSTPSPSLHRAFLTAFTGAEAASGEEGGLSFALEGGRIDVVRARPGGDQASDAARLSFFTVPIANLAEQADRLSAAAIPFEISDDHLIVAPDTAHGVEIRFAPAHSPGRI